MSTENSILARVAMLAVVFGLVGCSTSSPSHYISPRVTGRIIDAKSGLPIEGVRVSKIDNSERTRSLDSAKGGEQMVKGGAVSSAADGLFVIPSERDLAFLRAVGWYSLTLSFEHPAYYKSIKTYTPKNATNAPSGEPWIDAGDVPMDRLNK